MPTTIAELLKKLIELQGSDLHLVAGLPPAARVHGLLKPIPDAGPIEPGAAREMIFSLLTEDQKRSFESDAQTRYELDFGYGLPGVGRFRCNIYKQRGSISANFRALSSVIPKLDELGLPDAVRGFTTAKKGLVLVTGPTGSGKSTTLAAIIDTINDTRSDHIITIEDPIEYLHNAKKSYVSQREVGPAGDTLSFRNALKYALRQDPDVILVGEMRDFETIGIALTSAETGHLVFATLHTNTAAQTIDRIVDVFPHEQQPQIRTLLASNLLGILSQLLLPRSDQSGRALACEVLVANHAVRNNIRMAKTEAIYQTMQTSAAEGMQTMDTSLLRLFREGHIDMETARPYIHDKTTLETMKSHAPRHPRPATLHGAAGTGHPRTGSSGERG